MLILVGEVSFPDCQGLKSEIVIIGWAHHIKYVDIRYELSFSWHYGLAWRVWEISLIVEFKIAYVYDTSCDSAHYSW
jgi:hypothetical protein